jgi:general secretion pathway protein N
VSTERGIRQRLAQAGPLTWALAAVCGWALLLWRAALLGLGSRLGQAEASAASALPVPVPPGQERIGPLGQYAEAAARPLFTEDRRPRAFVAVGPNEGGDGANGTALDFQLTGVLISPQVRLAILLPAGGGEPQRVREGGVPEGAAGWRLLEVQPRRAVFEGPGGQTTLELRAFGVAGMPANPPRGADMQADAEAPIALQPAPPPPPPAAASAQPTEEARRIEDIRRRIEARRAQLRQQPQNQSQNAGDGGARPRPLSGPAR